MLSLPPWRQRREGFSSGHFLAKAGEADLFLGSEHTKFWIAQRFLVRVWGTVTSTLRCLATIVVRHGVPQHGSEVFVRSRSFYEVTQTVPKRSQGVCQTAFCW